MTLRNALSPVAPSTNAASFRSVGMLCSAPVHTRKKYGKPSHRLTSSTENRAHHGSPSQLMLVFRISLRMPKSVFIIPCQTRMVMNVGSAYGRISSTRYVRRPFIRSFANTIASSMPERELSRHGDASRTPSSRRTPRRTARAGWGR